MRNQYEEPPLQRASVKKIVLRNFKSIKELSIDVRKGINLLVGPNAGGKTNILEAIYFLRKALVEEAGKTPYLPHAPKYWSPLDLVYMRDPTEKIAIELHVDYYYRFRRIPYWSNIILHNNIVFRVEFKVFRITEEYDTIRPIRYIVEVNKKSIFKITLDGVSVKIDNNLLDEAKRTLESEKYRPIFDEYVREDKMSVFKSEWRAPIEGPLIFFKILPQSITHLYKCIRREDNNRMFCILEEFIPLLRYRSLPYVIESNIVEGIEEGFDVRKGYVYPSLRSFQRLLERVLDGIVLLRHPDVGSLREPKPYTGELKLDERAANLAGVLLALQGRYGRFPERVEKALLELFPGFKVRIDSKFGRVAIVGEENGLELPPSNIPDGLIKLLAIMTAVELKPSILLIDEIENSMHARMLEYVVDVLDNLNIPVLVASHSPVIADLVGPDKTIIVYRKPGEGTIAEKIREPDKLSKKLSELGVAFSDYLFYKKTYEAHTNHNENP